MYRGLLIDLEKFSGGCGAGGYTTGAGGYTTKVIIVSVRVLFFGNKVYLRILRYSWVYSGILGYTWVYSGMLGYSS